MIYVSGDLLLFDFHNHKGKTKKRKVVFHGIEYTTSPHFPDEEAWFIHGYCLDKFKHLKFKMDRMSNVETDRSPL